MTTVQNTTSTDTGLACLMLVLRFHDYSVDSGQLQHQQNLQNKNFDFEKMQLAARDMGLKTRLIQTDFSDMNKLAFPAIAQYEDGRYVVIAAMRDQQVLVHDPVCEKPQTFGQSEFEKLWNRKLCLFQKRFRLNALQRHFDIKWFIPVIVRYKKLFLEVVVASFFIQAFALVTPLFFQVIIDKVLVHQSLSTLDVLAAGLLVLSVFEIILTLLRTYIFSHTTHRVDVILGSRLFRHLLRLPLSYFEIRRVGDSVARVRELDSIRQFLTGSTLTLVIDVLFSGIFFSVLFYYSPLLTAVVAGSIPLYILLSLAITPVLRSRLQEKFNLGAENQAFLVESVSGIQTLKSLSVESRMQQLWEQQLAGYIRSDFNTAWLGNLASQFAVLINKLVVVLILWVGATLVIKGGLSVGQLIAFNMIAARISGPVLRLVQLWQDFQQAGLSIQRLGDILNQPQEPGYQQGKTSLKNLQGAVTFEQVKFSYANSDKSVLNQINLDVSPGEVIGVVGRSGSGKSTLTKLIQRLYVPDSGRILIDGQDMALIDASWLRRQIGVVLQENFLFNRTVRENIALADPAMSLEQVMAAAQAAGAHDFILELPSGYDTLIEEQGSNLSGGQRQRIAIARALVTNPKILILDEATSALDYESERIVQQNMKNICRGRTVFIIAHRLSAVREADRIVVMNEGRIEEQGKHAELLKNNGSYAKLYHLQFSVSR